MRHREERRRHEDPREDDAQAESGGRPAASGAKVSSDAAEPLDDVDDLLDEIENPRDRVACPRPTATLLGSVSAYLRHRKRPAANAAAISAPTELRRMMLPAQHGLPVPATVSPPRRLLRGSFADPADRLGLPFVLKATNAGGGRLNFLIETEADVLDTAVRAVEVMGCEIAGVNPVQDRHTRQWYPLEVGSGPAVGTGAFAEQKTRAYFACFRSKLSAGSSAARL